MNEVKKEKQPVRPVTVKIDDFRKKLNQTVADSELPPFLLEMILGEMLTAMSGVAEKERMQDREAWKKDCMEWEQGKKQGQTHKEGEKDG